MRWKTGVRATLTVLLAGLAVPAPAAETATLRLDWSILGYHAPFFLALERGYYREAGIDLTILEGKGSNTTIQLVGRNADTFGFADASAAAKAVSAGVPVKVVMGIIKRTTMSVLFREDGPIKSIRDLEGRTISVSPGDAPGLLLPAFLEANGLRASAVKVVAVDPSAKFRLLAEHKVDATCSYGPVVEVLLEGLGVKSKRFDYAASGIRLPAFGIVASTRTLEKSPDLVRRFLAATARGWKDAQAEPEAAVAAAAKRFPQLEAKRQNHVQMLKNFFPYIDTDRTAGKPFGWMSREDWQDAQAMLEKYLEVAPGTVDRYFTNALLE